MHDIKWIQENPKAFDAEMARRRVDPVASEILAMDEKRRHCIAKLQELQNKFNNWDTDLITRAKQSKSTQRGCKKCGSKVAVKYLKSIYCPVCGDSHFIKTETDNKAFVTLQVKLKAQQTKVNEMAKKYEEKNKDNCWYIGAWCAE